MDRADVGQYRTWRHERGAGWLRLGLWLGVIGWFVFGLAPWLQSRIDAVDTLGQYIEESGIDAGAIYYTEVEEVADADLYLSDMFRFFLPSQRQR